MIVQNQNGERIRTDLMQCDHCKKMMSVKGTVIQETAFGEFRVRHFSCPHCGATYNAGTSDEQQRELYRRITKAKHKIRMGNEKHWTKKTRQKHQKELKNASDAAKSRSSMLSKIGDQLLAGENPEEILRRTEEQHGEE